MAERKITHLKVSAALFNSMVSILDQLPAKTSRQVLNAVEDGNHCEPIFATGDLGGHKRTDPHNGSPPGEKASTKKAKRPKVAPKKGRK